MKMQNSFINRKNFLYLFQLFIISVILVFSPFAFAKDRIQYHVQGADGSTLKTINEQGVVTQSYQYSPFGQQLQYKKPANLKNPKAFVGGVQDATDLVYLQQRHYNPVLGRFYQPDPVTFLEKGHGQTNRYQYGWNDSYSFKDSSGLNPEFLMVTDPRAYYELRAMEFGYDINTYDGMNATAKAVQKEAFYELLGWGLSYGLGKISTSIYSKFFSKNIEYLDPATLFWTQRTAGGNGRAAPLRESMLSNGYKGPPIDVVRFPYGNVTLDHTRAAIALEQGITRIPATIRMPNELLPKDMIGRFGNAKTWGEAVIQRTSNQRPPLSPQGTTVPPRLPRQ